ncbi:Formate dehydrogenase large subunit [Sulfurospirillum diekertiae]|uniref:Formate dehydrogenase large subunit n=2 Tax=Sulfurospirillum diekertiae TaxID=1854492 RepID=A0A1Y0HRM2_9BACT|nr:Formate dehydrogenase large subunit [Sulfurospirillum diekertiae]ASC94594.1 Formate dehydrogenase large subunit [Sulfurospirillum diekertiae]
MSEIITALNAKVGRRSFLKMAAIAGAFGATAGFASEKVTRAATEEEVKNPYPGSKLVKTICNVCSVGCGVVAEVHNGVWVRQEVAQDHPLSLGGHCCKGAGMIDMIRSDVRVKYPMEKVGGQWKRISWEDAYTKIGTQLKAIREKHGPDAAMFLGSAKMSNEQAYYLRKFAAFYGTNNIDHQARLCHSSTVTGVANTFGYGAMTNQLGDIQNSKAVLIMGANPAVAHPVGFQHFLKAKERNNTKLIVVEPRFTKTAAKADMYVRLRSGTDIAFIYGMIHLILKNGWEDKKYLQDRVYGYEDVFKESEKWTPDVVSKVTGVSEEELYQVTKTFASTKPGCLVWTMGWTQHSVGTGNTRVGPILQMILGNMGVEGGGCNILRGHDNVQGASDMGCSSETLPGYYGLAEPAWKHFANVWKVEPEYIKGRFKNAEMMTKNGFTLARWSEGVMKNDAIYNGGTDLKALVVMGCGITSTAQLQEVKKGLDNIELLVITDPFINDAAILTDRKDNLFILPVATQFETSGSVTATGRNVQWRSKVVEPQYECKTDHDIMFEFAKRLGFYDEYTKALGDGKGKFEWPEDATREIARGIRSIGMGGHTPERLKKHQENWHMFEEVSIAGMGPMKGEYYGLPWPCWNETHSGSPILYNVNKPVSDGGMGFRLNWGVEKDGVTLLAGEGSAPKGSAITKGHGPLTLEMLEKAGATFSEEEKAIVAGKNFATDLSGILIKKGLALGLTPYGNGKARAKAWNFPDQIPLHREPIHSPSQEMIKAYPTYPDKKDHFRVDTKYISAQTRQDYTKEFPLIMITGRLVTHSGAGAETRASKYLSKLNPEMFVDIHPNTALNLGIRNGEMVWVYGVEGTRIHVKAKFSQTVDEKTIFMPFHYMGKFQGKDLSANYPTGTKPYATGESANTVVGYGYDIMTQIPETKTGLCRIEKA